MLANWGLPYMKLAVFSLHLDLSVPSIRRDNAGKPFAQISALGSKNSPWKSVLCDIFPREISASLVKGFLLGLRQYPKSAVHMPKCFEK